MTTELSRLLDEAALDADSIALSVDHMIRSGRRRRRGRHLLEAAAAGLGTAAVLVAGFLFSSPSRPEGATGGPDPAPGRGADIRIAGDGAITAVFHDPYATAATLRALFKQRGLDIRVDLVNASPSLVGRPVAAGRGPGLGEGSMTMTGNTDECENTPGCPAGLTVSGDWTGSGSIAIGVPTPNGQPYGTGGNVTAYDEPLACTDIFGKTVKQAQGILAARHLHLEWHGIGNVLIDPAKSADLVVSSVALFSPAGDGKIWAAPADDVVGSETMNLPCHRTAVARAG